MNINVAGSFLRYCGRDVRNLYVLLKLCAVLQMHTYILCKAKFFFVSVLLT